MLTIDDYKNWLEACLQVGIPAISTDTCARIMAVLYEYGNNEGFTFNRKFLAEKDYIQERFGLKAMGVPDPNFTSLLQAYIKELEEYQEAHRNDPRNPSHPYRCMAPDWAPNLLEDRYQMKFIG